MATTATNTPAPQVATQEASSVTQADITAWLRTRQRALLWGGGILALIVFVAWFMFESGRRKQSVASEALDRARNAADQGNLAAASGEFQKISQSFSGTDAAMQAILALNQVRLQNKQGPLAVDDLRKFVGTNPPPAFGAAANRLLGTALENGTKFAEAAAAYEKSSELAVEDYLKAEALLAAGRAYRLSGNREKALAALRTVIEKYPKTASKSEAEVRLGEMTKGAQ